MLTKKLEPTPQLLIFSGSANLKLAEDVALYIGKPLCKVDIGSFADGETRVQILDNVRGGDVFIIQPTCPPVNQHLMELLIMIDALRRSSAKSITAVIPYFGYARQDRKVQPRVPISAKLVANLLAAAGINRILTVDLHAGQIQGFFDIPVDNLTGDVIFFEYLKEMQKQIDGSMVLIAPDAGAVERVRNLAEHLHVDIAIIDKRRQSYNRSEVWHIVGDVTDKTAVLIDDIVDTGGTLCNAAEALMKHGAREVNACCTHGIFSANAIEKINASAINKLFVTDSIPLRNKCSHKIELVSLGNLLGEAILRIHHAQSLSELFKLT